MHTGAYESLDAVLDHYDDPNDAVDDFFDDGGWCQLEQFDGVPNCASLYTNARRTTQAVLDKMANERARNDPAALPNVNLNNGERNDILAFLRTLTDPCVTDRACLSPWTPASNEAADDLQLNAVDINGNAL
jgi:cytochrome c peroxidase